MFFIKRIWSRFSEPWLCHNYIYVRAIVTFTNSSNQNLFTGDKGTCMDSRKLHKSCDYPPSLSQYNNQTNMKQIALPIFSTPLRVILITSEIKQI